VKAVIYYTFIPPKQAFSVKRFLAKKSNVFTWFGPVYLFMLLKLKTSFKGAHLELLKSHLKQRDGNT
jgi:hypothetical protein